MNKPKVILVTGTLDSGKTTLLNEVGKYPYVEVVKEVAQDLIDQYGYQITQDPEFQDIVFAEQLAREKHAQDSGKSFIICDRGTVDIVGFCRVIGVPVKPEWQAALFNRYDRVAIFNKNDINFKPEAYQVDFDMTEYRDRVDQSIRSVLAEIHITPSEIRGTHERRIRQFSQLLSELSFIEGTHLKQEGAHRLERY